MKQVSCKNDKAFYLSYQQLDPTVSLSRLGLPSMYGQALMAGTQMMVERPQADKIINAATFVKIIKIFNINIVKNNKIIKIKRSYAATFVVRRARYESGRVTEKYLQSSNIQF